MARHFSECVKGSVFIYGLAGRSGEVIEAEAERMFVAKARTWSQRLTPYSADLCSWLHATTCSDGCDSSS